MPELKEVNQDGDLYGDKKKIPTYYGEKNTELTGKLKEIEAETDGWNDDDDEKWEELLRTADNDEKVECGEYLETHEDEKKISIDDIKPDEKLIFLDKETHKKRVPIERDDNDNDIIINFNSIKREIEALYTEGNPNSSEQDVKMKSLLESVTDSFYKLQQQLEEQRQRIDSLEKESYLSKKEHDLHDGHRNILNSFNGMFDKFKKLLQTPFFREFPITIEEQAEFLSELKGVDIEDILSEYTEKEIEREYTEATKIDKEGETYETEKTLETKKEVNKEKIEKNRGLFPSLDEQAQFLSEIEGVDIDDILSEYTPEEIQDKYTEAVFEKELEDL